MKCVALYFIDITPICPGHAHAKSGVAKRARVDLNGRCDDTGQIFLARDASVDAGTG
jgi:hypothetical protein